MNGKTKVEKHFDSIAAKYNYYKNKNSFYYDNLKKLLSSYIPKNKKVLEVGCGTGDLITSLDPSKGWGMDISSEMIRVAKKRYGRKRKIEFSASMPKGTFDYVFMSDVIEHLEDPLVTFKEIVKRMNKKSLFICTMANPIWEPILMIGEELGYKMPEGPHKRITYKNILPMLKKSKLKVLKHDFALLMPISIPFVTDFLNNHLEKYMKKLSFIEYFVCEKL